MLEAMLMLFFSGRCLVWDFSIVAGDLFIYRCFYQSYIVKYLLYFIKCLNMQGFFYLSVDILFVNFIVRECYNCGKRFIKEDGCNKMVCSCRAVMCYLCKKPIKGYDHFSDNARGGTTTGKWVSYTIFPGDVSGTSDVACPTLLDYDGNHWCIVMYFYTLELKLLLATFWVPNKNKLLPQHTVLQVMISVAHCSVLKVLVTANPCEKSIIFHCFRWLASIQWTVGLNILWRATYVYLWDLQHKGD